MSSIKNVSPLIDHGSSAPKPQGITTDIWAYLIDRVSLAELTAFVDANPSVGVEANIRTPALGAQVTYLAIDSAQHAAARAAGVALAPSEGKCRAQSFDWSSGVTGWEP